jgi:hypothetical protein
MNTTETHTKSGGASRTEEVKARGTVQQEPPMKAEPQREHEWLQKAVGEWTFEGEITMEPGKPPAKLEGTESIRSLGGFWILLEGQCEMPSGPETMLVTLGYDPQKKRFVGTFIASMMPHLWLYDGGLDADEKVLTLNTEGPSMTAEGKMARFKDVMEIKSDDHRVLTSHMLGDDGKWRKVMTIHYRRT